MKRLSFPVLVILMMAAGCMLIPASPLPANQPPSAYIDSVSSGQVSPGETVIFKGHGIDTDGAVAAYRWRSSIDGELSTSSTFESSSLSEGSHTIWFRVQDDTGDWSKEVPCHVTVLPSGIVLPVIDLFEASPADIAEGESSTMHWSVSGASMVKIDPGIGNVALTGNRVVSPTKTTTYTLTATNEAGSVISTTQVVVATVPLHTVELFSIAAEDGHVKKNGEVGQAPDVGDTKTSVAMQAFLSFDISMIPTGATIKSASLDLVTGDIFGFPFTKLGWLGVYNHQYGDLAKDDFVLGPAVGAMFTTAVPPSSPFSSSLLTSAVQTQVDAASPRFQIRLQFQKYAVYDRTADYLAFGEANPRLVIKYED